VLANIATRAHDRTLRTNTSWWEMHGGKLRSLIEWLAENKIVALLCGVASLAGLYFALWPRK
jgi:hypothetical protein